MERYDAATLLIELAEKMGLLAAAALVAVLIPPLRNRLLGVGRRRDKLAAVVLGLGLSAWGAMLGFHPNFANWLFLLKRIKRCGLRIRDLPPIDLVLLTHAHFDHFHKPTLRRLPYPKIGVKPWGMGDLAYNLGFSRIVELDWWETFSHGTWKVTLTPCKHWGARVLRDHHRGYGGFVLEHQGRSIYHAGDSAYFEGFKEIGRVCHPEIALLPIGAYHPETFRHVHMGPDDAIRVFKDLLAKKLVPMHYGSFRLAFEDMDEPPRWLKQLAHDHGMTKRLVFLEEGSPQLF